MIGYPLIDRARPLNLRVGRFSLLGAHNLAMCTIGYHLLAQDNDSYLRRSLPSPRCPECGFLLDRHSIDPNAVVVRRCYDVSRSYDGVAVASLRFKEALLRWGYPASIFSPLPGDPEFFALRPTNILSFDAVRRRTRFESYCAACRTYGVIAGASPVFLIGVSSPLAAGLYRTDVEFGSGDERSPLLIVSPTTRDQLLPERLRGFTCEEIQGTA